MALRRSGVRLPSGPLKKTGAQDIWCRFCHNIQASTGVVGHSPASRESEVRARRGASESARKAELACGPDEKARPDRQPV